MTIVPPLLVDALPEQLWSSANLYQVFGQSLHSCVGGEGSTGVRTIEINGREVDHGRLPFTDFAEPLSAEGQLRRWRFDLGWLLVGGVAIYVAFALRLSRLLRRLTG